MPISMFTLYMLVMLDSICMLLGWALSIAIGLSCLYAFINAFRMSSCNESDKTELANEIRSVTIKTLWKISAPVIIVLSLLFTLVPTTKQVAFIYVVSKLSSTSQMKNIGENTLNIPDKALQVLNLKMNEYLEDMKGEAIKEAEKEVGNVIDKAAATK